MKFGMNIGRYKTIVMKKKILENSKTGPTQAPKTIKNPGFCCLDRAPQQIFEKKIVHMKHLTYTYDGTKFQIKSFCASKVIANSLWN